VQRVAAAVVHGGGERHRRRQEGLHLIEAEVVALQPEGEVEHVGVGGPRMRGDEVGNQVLLLAGFLRELLEHQPELLVGTHPRFHHVRQRSILGVFRGDLQVAADMVPHEFTDVLGVAHGKVVTQAGADQHLLHPGQRPRLAIELQQRRVVGVQILADAREDARQAAAGRLDLPVLARQAVHVRRRSAEIGDDAGEAGRAIADLLDLAQDRLLRAALDDPPLVLGDRAEGAAAEAAAHDVDREADHLEGGNLRLAVGRMRLALERRGEDAVHLGSGERDRWRVEPDVALAVRLHQRTRVARVRFEMEDARGMCIEHRVGRHLLIRRQTDRRLRTGQLRHAHVGLQVELDDLAARRGRSCRLLAGAVGTGRAIGSGGGHGVGIGVADQHPGRIDARRVDLAPTLARQPATRHHERAAAQVADVADPLAGGEAVGEFDDRPLGVAEEQQVGFRIGQHRAPHLVRPIVVVGDSPQAGLDRADDDVAAGKGLATALRVDHQRAVRPPVGFAVRRVGIVGTWLAVGRVAIDHRIHVAGGDAEEQVRLAKGAEGSRRPPVGLADDADAEPLRLEQAADQRHAEARMVDVGVASDEDDVAGIPAKRIHLAARHRQERRRAETAGPVFPPREEAARGGGGDCCVLSVHGAAILQQAPPPAGRTRRARNQRR
jgi:hypothetical protein